MSTRMEIIGGGQRGWYLCKGARARWRVAMPAAISTGTRAAANALEKLSVVEREQVA